MRLSEGDRHILGLLRPGLRIETQIILWTAQAWLDSLQHGPRFTPEQVVRFYEFLKPLGKAGDLTLLPPDVALEAAIANAREDLMLIDHAESLLADSTLADGDPAAVKPGESVGDDAERQWRVKSGRSSGPPPDPKMPNPALQSGAQGRPLKRENLSRPKYRTARLAQLKIRGARVSALLRALAGKLVFSFFGVGSHQAGVKAARAAVFSAGAGTLYPRASGRALVADSAVTVADTIADRAWFDDHPARRYRVRAGWAVRRRGRDTFLRVRLGDARRYPDSESGAEFAWWINAYPFLSARVRRRLMKAARPP